MNLMNVHRLIDLRISNQIAYLFDLAFTLEIHGSTKEQIPPVKPKLVGVS